ncbi:MAG: CarD family transcriptional regulator, partial [Methylococcales bacterium]
DELRAQFNQRLRIEICDAQSPHYSKAIAIPEQVVPDLPWTQKNEAPGTALQSFLNHYPGRVLLAADSAGRREALIELLNAAGLAFHQVSDWSAFLKDNENKLGITVAAFEAGFAIDSPMLTVLTERQLFPERVEQSRRRKRVGRDPESIIRDLGEIAIGSPIVHEDHGVGRYQGLIALDTGGVSGEYLCIEYAKGDKLYVPVSQLQLVSRYSGASPDHAPLHSLGGEAWEKAKRKAAEKVRDVAAELLEIQARRHARQGMALPIDRSLYEPFAATFPFEETPDQFNAIEAVIADMDKATPMDRVVCGDVGFGKTEVAVRAAFVAATAGKQVAILVPTTLLAEQHYRNFRDRYADWPLR